VGIWTSADPLSEFPNSYSYAGANPVLLIDPLGLRTFKVIRGMRADPEGNHVISESDMYAASAEWSAQVVNQADYDPRVDGIVFLDVNDVASFEDAIMNHNDYGDIGGIAYLGHSSDGKLHVNMNPGTPDVTSATINGLSPTFAANAWVGLTSCNSSSMAQHMSATWNVRAFGNATRTKGILRGPYRHPVGYRVDFYNNGVSTGSRRYSARDLDTHY
jgi:hypothetical protein